ncbi:MAG: MFS transporter [Sphingomonas fennica]
MAGAGATGGSILADRAMTGRQAFVIFLSVVLNALDGFDVLAITFAAPGIARDWAVSLSALGIVISTGLVGMVAGSIVIAPLADRIGRRPTIIGCCALMGLGMVLTSTAGSVAMLSVWRVVTGLGIGGMIAAVTAVAAEFGNERRRDLCVSLMTVGYPIGGLLGGLASAWLVEQAGWRAIFWAGGLATLAVVPVLLAALPESPEYLLGRGGADMRQRIDAVLAKLGHAPLRGLPVSTERPVRASPLELFGPAFRRTTIFLVIGYFLHIMTFYFFSGWLPKIMTDGGFTVPQAIATSAIMNVGGVMGGAVIGWAAPRFGLKRLAICSMIGTTALMAAFGLGGAGLAALRVLAFLLGIAIFGGVVGLYAFLARAYPARLRVTGSGFAIAMGRGGAVVGPVLGGFLLEAGLPAGQVLAIIGAAATAGAVFLLPIPIGRPLDRPTLTPETLS